MVTDIGCLYFMQFCATLTRCMTFNCALHYSNYVTIARSKRGKGNDHYFQVTGDLCLTLN